MQLGIPNITKKALPWIATARGPGEPPMPVIALRYVKPIWERTAFTSWVGAVLGAASGYFLSVPIALSWEQAKAVVITATIAAVMALFVTKDSTGEVPPPPK